MNTILALVICWILMPIYNPSNLKVSAGTLSANRSDLTFADVNGVSFGLETNGVITGSVDGAAPGAVNFSAGTTSSGLGSVVFSNSGGVSFGLNGSTVTATVVTTYQPAGAYLTTARASNDAVGLNTALTANGVSWTVNSSGLSLNVPAFLTTAQAVGAYLTTARASNDAVGLNTALTANGVSWTVNSSGLSLNVPAFLTTAALSNHSHGNPTLALTNLTGTTASASNGFTLSLSAAAAGGGAAISGGTLSQNTGTVNFSNSNGVTFGLNTNGVMTASVAAGAAGPAKSYFFWPAQQVLGFSAFQASGSSKYIQPFYLPFDVSVSYLRLNLSGSLIGSMASLTTSANATLGFTQSSTFQVAFYTLGVGASSLSLQYYATGSASWVQQALISGGAVASNWSSGHTISYPFAGGYTNFTSSTSTALTNRTIQSSQLSNFSAVHFLDIPLATSFAAGVYWMAFNSISSISTIGNANISTVRLVASICGVSQLAQGGDPIGFAANVSNPFHVGLGSWSTNSIGTTTSSIGLASISRINSNPVIAFQMIRQA